jgi:hypothetical protein
MSDHYRIKCNDGIARDFYWPDEFLQAFKKVFAKRHMCEDGKNGNYIKTQYQKNMEAVIKAIQ